MAKLPDRRHIRLVDRKFQLGLAWRLVLAMTGCFLAGIVLAFLPSAWVLATQNDLKSLEAAGSEFLVLHRRIWPAAFLSFAGAFVYCLILSRRIAGPAQRINAVLLQMLHGEPPAEVRFRKKDYFHRTAELLTAVCGKLRESRSGGTGPEDAPR